MDKEQLFQELNNQISNGNLTREEISQRLGLVPVASTTGLNFQPNVKETHHFSVTKMLYVMGAAIVLIGILFFIAQIWDDMGAIGRVSITLGLGLILTLLGTVLYKQKPESSIGTVFTAIGGLLMPTGVVVLLSEMFRADWLNNEEWSLAIVFVLLFIFYALLNYVHKKATLTFFAYVNGTIALYLLAYAIFNETLSYGKMEDLFVYLTMALGLCYLASAHVFQENWNNKLVGSLEFFGTAGFLGAAFVRVLDSSAWELLYVIVVLGCLWLSVKMRSKAILVISTIFLLVYVSYITAEYFANSIGWPIALVLLGFIFIGLGYASLTINKKYIKEVE